MPLGLVRGMLVGLSFIASKGADALVLGTGYAYEQKAPRATRPRYLPQADVGPGLTGR